MDKVQIKLHCTNCDTYFKQIDIRNRKDGATLLAQGRIVVDRKDNKSYLETITYIPLTSKMYCPACKKNITNIILRMGATESILYTRVDYVKIGV